MYVSSVNYYSNMNLSYKAKKNRNINFQKIIKPPVTDEVTKMPILEHHPDLYKLQKEYDVLASNYFRRGSFYGSSDEKFADVINALKLFFNENVLTNTGNNKIKMLVAGIGESQEPFSLLATVKSLIGKNEIGNVLDMHTVDLQGKPDNDTIFQQSFYDSCREPAFVKSSFVIATDDEQYSVRRYGTVYRVSDDICKYLTEVYNNPEKAKWKSRIQEVIKEYPDEEFKIVSMNNTIGYIHDLEDRMETLKNVYRVLTPGGIFILDNRLREEYTKVFTPENSAEIYTGIYKKL